MNNIPEAFEFINNAFQHKDISAILEVGFLTGDSFQCMYPIQNGKKLPMGFWIQDFKLHVFSHAPTHIVENNLCMRVRIAILAPNDTRIFRFNADKYELSYTTRDYCIDLSIQERK